MFNSADSVNKEVDSDIGPHTRVLFMNSTRRVSQQTATSVNFRGIMDPVSDSSKSVGERERERETRDCVVTEIS